MEEDILSLYIDYTSNTEVPTFFSRWCFLSGIGAYLGRQFYFPFGQSHINTNMYCMLIGSPGTKKSTAIKTMKRILMEAGYDTIAADKTSKEKFLVDLEASEEIDQYNTIEELLDRNIFKDSFAAREMFIMADEFNDFIGINNLEFISLLGNLWDYEGKFKYRIKTGKSLSIPDPTISILGGNTQRNFAAAFPPDIFGQGFFSRLLLIYGEPNGKSIPFPEPRDPSFTAELVRCIQHVKQTVNGCARITESAKSLLGKIYSTTRFTTDPRFETYYQRRHTHLLKLCLIFAAIRLTTEIDESIVIRANTTLRFTEQLMPKALGEFGKARTSDITHKIVQALESSDDPLSFKDLWKLVSSDFETMTQLADKLRNLVEADKIQRINGHGYLPVREIYDRPNDSDMFDWSILTEEEMRISR